VGETAAAAIAQAPAPLAFPPKALAKPSRIIESERPLDRWITPCPACEGDVLVLRLPDDQCLVLFREAEDLHLQWRPVGPSPRLPQLAFRQKNGNLPPGGSGLRAGVRNRPVPFPSAHPSNSTRQHPLELSCSAQEKTKGPRDEREDLRTKYQGFKPDPGNSAVRHYRGLGKRGHDGIANPPCTERVRVGTLRLKQMRPSSIPTIMSQWVKLHNFKTASRAARVPNSCLS